MGNCSSIQLSCETITARCWDFLAGQAAFICKLEDNLDALKTEVDKLKALSEDVMTRVRVAEEQQQLKPLAEVEQWCSRAETLAKEADLLIEEGCQQKYKLCMGGCCSRHPVSSHMFRNQIAKKLQEVQDPWRDGDFSKVAGSEPLPSVMQRPSEPTVGIEFTFDKIWSSLQDEQVGIIGLYGLGEVGKTTLIHQVNNRFLPNDLERTCINNTGQTYLKCGKPALEKEANCFFLAESYKTAAEVYAQVPNISKCLFACTRGKLFGKGLNYLQCWKDDQEIVQRCKDLEELEQKFWENCAHHVHFFGSMKMKRGFLWSIGCYDELLSLGDEEDNLKVVLSLCTFFQSDRDIEMPKADQQAYVKAILSVCTVVRSDRDIDLKAEDFDNADELIDILVDAECIKDKEILFLGLQL